MILVRRWDLHRFHEYHKDNCHTIEKCIQLQSNIEKLIQQGHMKKFIQKDAKTQQDQTDEGFDKNDSHTEKEHL